MGDVARIPFGEESDLMPEEEQHDAPAPKKRRRNTPVIFIAVLTAAATAALAFLIVRIAGNFSDKKRGEEIYDDAAAIFDRELSADIYPSEEYSDVPTVYDRIKDGAAEDTSGGEMSAELAAARAKITSLKQINPDVVGWMKVEGTKINYPLMRSETGDDAFYLNHAYTGEYNSYGSIFMVSTCYEEFENNRNTVVFGHNIVTGAMFHDITKFFDPEFFGSAELHIYTLNAEYIFKPFSVYETTSSYNYIKTAFASDASFMSFVTEIKSNSAVSSDIELTGSDSILALSTCTATSGISEGRYALHLKLAEIKN